MLKSVQANNENQKEMDLLGRLRGGSSKLAAGILIGTSLMVVPRAMGQDATTVKDAATVNMCYKKVHDVNTIGPLLIKDQANHNWVSFSLNKNEYIAIKKSIPIDPDGMDVYKIKENKAIKLNSKEKAKLFQDNGVRHVITSTMIKLSHVHPPSTPLPHR